MQADNLLLVTHLKSLKCIGSSFPSQLWLRLANWLKSSWSVYSHIKGQTMARARAFESYHAKTIFIKATCYHYISSSPNPYIIMCISEPVPALCSVQQLTEILLWAGRCGCWLPVQGTGQPRAVPCPEGDGAHHSPASYQTDTEEGLGGGREK